MTSPGISSITGVVSCAMHLRSLPQLGHGRSLAGTGIGFSTRRSPGGGGLRTGGCFGGFGGSGLPPFCFATSSSFLFAAARSPLATLLSLLRKRSSWPGEMCSPRFLLSRSLPSNSSSS